jgi:hypothetical protein
MSSSVTTAPPITYTTRDPKFAAHLIEKGLLLPNDVANNAGEISFVFDDPHRAGAALFQQFVDGLKPEYSHRGGIVLPDGFVETLSNGKYLVWRNGVTERRTSWPMEQGQVSCPPDHRMVKERVILLADKPSPYGTQQELFYEIKSFLHRYIDIPSFWEDLLGHYALMTWVYDAFQSLPYIRFLGEFATGKTRMLEVVRELCYRSAMANGAASNASIFRIIDEWRGTFALDEADFSKSAEWSDITKILNCGYKQGNPVLRAEGNAAHSYSARAFYVFGPKILSTRRRFDDPALESRCLTCHTTERSLRPDVPLDLPPKFFDEARALRNELLQWRFDNFTRFQNAASVERVGGDLRLNQITGPLDVVASSEEFRAELREFKSSYSSSERSQRPAAMVLDAIKAIWDARLPKERPKPILLTAIVQHYDKVSEGMGETRSDDYKTLTDPRRVASLLRSMEFDLRRTNRGMVVFVDEMLLARKRKEYGLSEEK